MTDIQNNTTRILWDKFWWSRKNAEDFYSGSGRMISRIIRNIPVRNKRILEVGAGTGQSSADLLRAGAQVFLLDYSEMAIEFLKQHKRVNPSLFIVRADALALPFRRGCMDIVFHQGLLEHFHEPKDVLEENNRVLKNKGWLLADVPQKYHIYTLVKHLLMIINAWFAGRETEFTIKQFKKLVGDTGFHIQNIYGSGMLPSLLYRTVRMILQRFRMYLPMYPKQSRMGSVIRKNIQRWFDKESFLLNFCVHIGILAQKTDGPLI